MKNKTTFTSQEVKSVAVLARIPVNEKEVRELAEGFSKVLEVVDKLNEIDTAKIEPTHQVTNLTNIFRDDIVDTSRMFNQDQALSNAKRTYHGYFLVPRILESE